MKKFWKYALVAMLAVAMLFSFASCDDDDDDDDDDDSLTDAKIVNIVAAGLVDAITTVDDDGNYTYASWELDTTTYTLAIMTTSDYEGYVDSAYEVAADASDAYTVTIDTGSYVYVYLGYMSAGAGPVVVYVDATIDGEDEDLALTAYLNSTLTVLTSEDNTTVTETDEETGEEVTTTTDYTPSLTINDEDSDLTEDEISKLVSNLISNVMSAMSSNSSSDSSAS